MKIILHCIAFFLHIFIAYSASGQSLVQKTDTVAAVDTVEAAANINVLYEATKPKYYNGAYSQISGENIKNIPTVSSLGTLSGRATGVFSASADGLPGYENASFYVRGAHTFSGSNAPVVLVDGRLDDIRMLDLHDIESITVLKDAASSALYGLLSANGIILITTKKAQEGRVTVQFNNQTSFSQPTRMPKYLDAYNYSLLYNEAMLNDDPAAVVRYSPTALEAYRSGSDPIMYPNNNWIEEFLTDYSIQTRNNINIGGGNEKSRFYISANHFSSNGLFKVDPSVNTYSTNTRINSFNIHGNVSLNIGKNLLLNADIRTRKDKHNAPGAYSTRYDESLFANIYATPFNAYPIKNPDGSLGGTMDYSNNIYGVLNNSGYSTLENTSVSSFVDLTVDLGQLVKGLKAKGLAGFNNYTDYSINRSKDFAVYNYDGNGYNKIGQDSPISNNGTYRNDYRNYQHSLSFLYERQFGRHNLDGFLMYERIQTDNKLSEDLFNNYQGPKGKISYRFRDTYMLDLALAYQGSEQYPENNRYGFFPAIAGGWILTNEPFFKKNDFFSFLKVRGSYGLTGNMASTYFGYLEAYSTGSNVTFGINPSGQSSYMENQVPNPTLTWAKTKKSNLGLDLMLLKNRFNLSFDVFSDKTYDILIQNAITSMYGASIFVPEGKMNNRGLEFSMGWRDKVNKLEYHANLNFSYAKNEIVYQNEEFKDYAWMYQTGMSYSTRFGYVFDRFFTEEDDFTYLPDQSFLGTQQPGDLKFKDLNRDGTINESDIAPIGKSVIPEIFYGLNLGLKYGSFDFEMLFNGAANSTTYNSGYTYWAFNNKTGNVLEHHLDRWTAGKGQNASYPRLTLSNANNYYTNSFWMQDNAFVRLKYVEVGYTFPEAVVKRIGMSNLRFFVNGNNLFSWDEVKFKDPEMTDSGLRYPLQQTFSAGLNVKF